MKIKLSATLLILAGIGICFGAFTTPIGSAAGPGQSPAHDYYQRLFEKDPAYKKVLSNIVYETRAENRGVKETNGDNIPLYPGGRITPFALNPAAPWCLAFVTYKLLRVAQSSWRPDSALTDFLDPHPALKSRMVIEAAGPKLVPVNVFEFWNWAKQTGRATQLAWPGTLIVYRSGPGHIGIVTQINRRGQAIVSIEGNKDDQVKKVRVKQEDILGFIRPTLAKGETPGSGPAPAPAPAPSQLERIKTDLSEKADELQISVKIDYSCQAFSRRGDTRVIGLGDAPTTRAWSTIKLPVIATYLRELGRARPPAAARADIGAAIRNSDNDALLRIWQRIAPSEQRRFDLLDQTLARGGAGIKSARDDGGTGYTAFGQTFWSGFAANNWYRALASGRITSRAATRLMMSPMANLDQDWGVDRAGFSFAKTGWGPEPAMAGRYTLRSTGVNRAGTEAATIVVIGKNSYESSINSAREISLWLKSNRSKIRSICRS